MLEPRIETLPAIRLLGVQATYISGLSPDTNAPETIGPLWGQLHERLGEITPAEPGVFYGWTFFRPPEQRARPDELEYVAGVEVAAEHTIPEGFAAVEAAGGLYAVFEHHGVMWTFHETVHRIYREWLPNSAYEGNGKGDLEHYDPRWVHDSEDSVYEFRVGSRPKG